MSQTITRVTIGDGPEWADVEVMESGLCVVVRSSIDKMFVATPGMTEMVRVLPHVVDDLKNRRSLSPKGE